MKKSEYINEYCCGCGLCTSVCGKELITIDDGFPNVKVSEKDELEIYEKICPVFYYHEAARHDVWGIIRKAYIGYSSNPDTRYRASSGGALTEICSYLLDKNIVDGIIHTTFNPENPITNITCVSYTTEEVKTRCGSRYSISTPLEDLTNIVKKGEKYAFVGKPCDVMALRRHMDAYSDFRSQIVVLLSFFCAGEPSIEAQYELLEKIGCKGKKCKSITYRGNGWPGFTTVEAHDGSIYKMEYKDAWGKHLGRSIRKVCRYCMDGTGDAADIVCADFWQLDNNGDADFSEHDGRNIIIARTQLGNDILEETVNDRYLTVEGDYTDRISIDFHKYQYSQYRRKSTMKSVVLALRIFGKNAPMYSYSYLNKYSKHADIGTKLRFFFGIVRRIRKKII